MICISNFTWLVPREITQLVYSSFSFRATFFNSLSSSLTKRLNTVKASITLKNSTYLFQVNTGNTRTLYKICSKLTIKTPVRCYWYCSGYFIAKFEQISTLILCFHCWLWTSKWQLSLISWTKSNVCNQANNKNLTKNKQN